MDAAVAVSWWETDEIGVGEVVEQASSQKSMSLCTPLSQVASSATPPGKRGTTGQVTTGLMLSVRWLSDVSVRLSLDSPHMLVAITSSA